MKIALCLSGQPRSVMKGFEYHKKNLLDHYDVTVFCHVWQTPIASEIFTTYKPARICVEASLDNDLSKYTRVPPPQPNWKVKDPARATWNQQYAILKSNELKLEFELEHKMHFDWVIRSRYDFALNVVIPFETLDSSKLYIPNCRMTPSRDFGNDQFAFSSSQNMDRYAESFNHIDRHYDDGVVMIGEDMMSVNWKENNLVGDNLVYFNPNHPFPPGTHNGTWHSLIRDDFENWQK